MPSFLHAMTADELLGAGKGWGGRESGATLLFLPCLTLFIVEIYSPPSSAFMFKTLDPL